jgi:hypothetical protein
VLFRVTVAAADPNGTALPGPARHLEGPFTLQTVALLGPAVTATVDGLVPMQAMRAHADTDARTRARRMVMQAMRVCTHICAGNAHLHAY